MERKCVLNSWSKKEVRAVIRYEWARGVSGIEIHNRLVEVYGPGVMSKQMVRRGCRTFSDGRQQVEDIPRAGRTRTATTDANVGKVDDMTRVNRRITIDEGHQSSAENKDLKYYSEYLCKIAVEFHLNLFAISQDPFCVD
ncbi:histone-lysine N-methyltransferase SETMAR [Trichonephila inaurata madagascariensis]|uniref:Histone-lysine N-methyltransferase SETMAR n=1 Tax=Trichonephila inaurata madagascariensis TaxID=2747483 RepID=A0A8X6Y8U0_9ARAC|nr:histone-lysine N-methyltransferase SETMAR [Trichonephila inaurata madagascariensis]